MHNLPVVLKVSGRRCVVVGGGPVAYRRAAALCHAGAEVTIVAREVDDQIINLDVFVERRQYTTSDLEGAFLVVIATDDLQVNERIVEDAAAMGVLTNRADRPDDGDFIVPATAHQGPVTISVHTGGISSAASAAIRNELVAALDPAWPNALQIVAPYRQLIQQRFPDAKQRIERLIKLTDPHAIELYKTQGADALKKYCESLANASA